jgi:hypothetical protein
MVCNICFGILLLMRYTKHYGGGHSEKGMFVDSGSDGGPFVRSGVCGGHDQDRASGSDDRIRGG